MAEKKKALGRGMSALLPTSKPQVGSRTNGAGVAQVSGQNLARELELGLIDANPYQTRTMTDDASLAELTESIKVSGVLQPILVRSVHGGRFQLIAGQRRLMASRRAGKRSILAVVRTMGDQQAMEATIVENLQREDLNAMEQAHAFDRLAREFKLTQEQIAQRTGKERATVTNFLRLLKLPEEVKAMISSSSLSMAHGKMLLALPSDQPESAVVALAKRAVEKGWSVKQLEEHVDMFREERPAKGKKARAVDANVRAAEEKLQRTLGCKVEITDKNGKGKIVLYYSDLTMFDLIQGKLER